MDKDAYKIMVFSWNTESVNLGETLDKNKAEYNRSSSSSLIDGLTTWRYTWNSPDFFYGLKDIIEQESPDIIVIGFQEDRYPGSYFHSHFLLEEMPLIGYELIKRNKLMGIGVTTYKNLFRGDLMSRGLRMSIYGKKDLVSSIELEENNLRQTLSNNGQTSYLCSSLLIRNKGALGSYLKLPNMPILSLICCHLPFDAQSLINEHAHQNYILRQNQLNNANIALNNIIENLALYSNLQPANVICFGDLNYRLNNENISATEMSKQFITNQDNKEWLNEIYNKYDELKQQMNKGNIYNFSEGINNEGPTFLPTCKMSKSRNLNQGFKMWRTGKYDQRVPSWCDRILYQNYPISTSKLECIYYNRFDIGDTMAKSDHAGVISIFIYSK